MNEVIAPKAMLVAGGTNERWATAALASSLGMPLDELNDE